MKNYNIFLNEITNTEEALLFQNLIRRWGWNCSISPHKKVVFYNELQLHHVSWRKEKNIRRNSFLCGVKEGGRGWSLNSTLPLYTKVQFHCHVMPCHSMVLTCHWNALTMLLPCHGYVIAMSLTGLGKRKSKL